MIPAIIVSVCVLLTFILFVIFIIRIIVKKVKKEQIDKKHVIGAIISGIMWAVLGITNVILFGLVFFNGDPLLDRLMNKGANAVSKTLVYTWQGIQENWNQETLGKVGLIEAALNDVIIKEEKDNSVSYSVLLTLNNKSEKDLFLTYYELIDQKLVFFTDKDDVFYGAGTKDEPANSVPVGKSKLTVTTTVPKSVELVTFHFAKQEFDLSSKTK